MNRKTQTWILLVLALISAGAASLLVGEGSLADQNLRDTFFQLRTWRLFNSMLAGAALAMGGVLVQGLFRNPLASPSILGTTAGANLGGMLVLLLWSSLLAETLPSWLPSELLLPLGCVLGALVSLLILLAVIGQRPGTVTVLLTGFILTSLFLSVGGLLTSMAQERWELGRAIVAFTLGGVESKGAQHVFLATPMVVISFVAALGWGRHLDALLAGEEEAASLGVNVKQVRRWVIIWVAMLTAAAVSIGGNVAFVGLVVPHALRPFIGVSHRQLVPAALVGGAAFLAWADVLTRLAPTTGPMPLGVITGLVGAPLFLVLLKRASREGRIA